MNLLLKHSDCLIEANRQTGNLEEEYLPEDKHFLESKDRGGADPAAQPDSKANPNYLDNLNNPNNLGADAAPATQPDAKANANNLHNLNNPYNLGADASEGAVGKAARHDEAEEKAAGLLVRRRFLRGFQQLSVRRAGNSNNAIHRLLQRLKQT